MVTQHPAIPFIKVLAAAVLGEVAAAPAGARGRKALDALFAAQKSLVLDVQFTGFTAKGEAVGGLHPVLLKAAGQLITHRATRLGFTPDVSADDLTALFSLAARPAAELGQGGLLEAVRERGLRGIYLTTAAGTYRPPAPVRPAAPPPPAAEETPAAPPSGSETPTPDAPPSAPVAETGGGDAVGPVDAGETAPAPPAPAAAWDEASTFDDFEVLEAFPDLAAEPAAAAAPAPGAPQPGQGSAGSGDMYHFFRASSSGVDPGLDELPALIRGAEAVSHFEDLLASAGRVISRELAGGNQAGVLDLLETISGEAERPDRSRIFRDAALTALRRVGAEGAYARLSELMQMAGPHRERIVRLFSFLGGEAVASLEAILFRTGDAELRDLLFRRLVRLEGMAPRLIARAMSEPSPVRTRALLELAAAPELDADTALRWLGEAAGHADAAVRADAARHASTIGGRGGLRLLVDMLGDREPAVRRAAISGLGTMGDSAAVPFLGRLLGDGGTDEDAQVLVIQALGRIASAEALPALLGVVNKRQLFSGRRLVRVKTAALQAIGKIQSPAAREVLVSVSNGKDADLAPEAKRILQLLD
jgi:hypothetical protein